MEKSDVKQSKKLRGVTHLHNLPAAVDENLDHGIIKGLVYIYEYDMTDIELFKKGLIESCGIPDAVQATLMTPRNHVSKPIIVSFRQHELPSYIDVPVEQAKTKLYEIKPKPLMCRKCLKYGHSVKYCRGNLSCARCGRANHEADECQESKILLSFL